MKWIELIVVKAVDTRNKPGFMGLMDHFMSSGHPERLTAVTLYRNAFVEDDICIHLQWEAEGNEPVKSDLGIKLAAALEEMGRVHHTLWIQKAIHAKQAKWGGHQASHQKPGSGQNKP